MSEALPRKEQDAEILITDDDRTSLMLLRANLSRWGFRVTTAENGRQAMELLLERPEIRLVIADWMMPEMDGIELCRRLRDGEAGRFVYTILLTSRKEVADVVEGLEAGANDYQGKPFQPRELRSRVEAGLRILAYETRLARANESLKRYAGEMEELAEERARQLVHSDRLATLGTMSAGIAHEINNPTAFISGNVQTLEQFWQVVDEMMKDFPLPEQLARRFEFIREETPQVLNGIREGVRRITRIVKGLKSYSSRTGEEFESVDLHEVIENALLLSTNRLKQHVTVEKRFAEDLPRLQGNPQELEQVFINLLVNAADAMERQGGGTLELWTSHEDGRIGITVQDNGSGIPKDLLERIWDPFFTTKGVGKGTGLGLAISLGIIERHKGQVKVDNRPEGGARFCITLPAMESVVVQ